jgi:hypothetical protein
MCQVGALQAADVLQLQALSAAGTTRGLSRCHPGNRLQVITSLLSGPVLFSRTVVPPGAAFAEEGGEKGGLH